MSIVCQHSEICSACPWMPIPYAEQKQRKIETLASSLRAFSGVSRFPDIQFISVGDSSLRDRADLVVYGGGYGLYARNKQLFSVKECPQLSENLFAFYEDLKAENINLKNSSHSKGSIRLRVSPTGERGLWLDFSNVDIQHLFEEKQTLHRLLRLVDNNGNESSGPRPLKSSETRSDESSSSEIFIEVGQRHKKLVWDENEKRFRLADPEFHVWTRTWIGDEAIPLYSVVGGFSQSSDHANRLIVKKISEMLSPCSAGSWLEFGCGNGNLTLALANHADHVLGLEYEGLAIEGLQKTLSALSSQSSSTTPPFSKRSQSLLEAVNKIQLQTGNFQKSLPEIFSGNSVQGLLVNPPRSGLKDFLNPLFEIPKSSRPKDFIYMSCFLDSFRLDAEKMMSLGYKIQELCIIDQFPQSPHFEILSRWSL